MNLRKDHYREDESSARIIEKQKTLGNKMSETRMAVKSRVSFSLVRLLCASSPIIFALGFHTPDVVGTVKVPLTDGVARSLLEVPFSVDMRR